MCQELLKIIVLTLLFNTRPFRFILSTTFSMSEDSHATVSTSSESQDSGSDSEDVKRLMKGMLQLMKSKARRKSAKVETKNKDNKKQKHREEHDLVVVTDSLLQNPTTPKKRQRVEFDQCTDSVAQAQLEQSTKVHSMVQTENVVVGALQSDEEQKSIEFWMDKAYHSDRQCRSYMSLLDDIVRRNEDHARQEEQRKESCSKTVSSLLRFLYEKRLVIPALTFHFCDRPPIDKAPVQLCLNLDLYESFVEWLSQHTQSDDMPIDRLYFVRTLRELGCHMDEYGQWEMFRSQDVFRLSPPVSATQSVTSTADQPSDASPPNTSKCTLEDFCAQFEILEPIESNRKRRTTLSQLYERLCLMEPLLAADYRTVQDLSVGIDRLITRAGLGWVKSGTSRAPSYFVCERKNEPSRPASTRSRAHKQSSSIDSSLSSPTAQDLEETDVAQSIASASRMVESDPCSTMSTTTTVIRPVYLLPDAAKTRPSAQSQEVGGATATNEWISRKIEQAITGRPTRVLNVLRDSVQENVEGSLKFYIGRSSNGVHGTEDRFEVHMRERKLSKFEVLYRTDVLNDSVLVESLLIDMFRTDPRLDNTMLSGSGGVGQKGPYVVYLAWR